VIEVIARRAGGTRRAIYGKLDGDLAAPSWASTRSRASRSAQFRRRRTLGEENSDEMRMGNDGKPVFLSNNAGAILAYLRLASWSWCASP